VISFQPYLHKLFLSEYFWADKVTKEIKYENYKTPQSMIDGLKYKTLDRWSIVLSKKDNSDFMSQKSGGFGFAYSTDEERIVIQVRIDSPADRAGLKRGDIILSVNGIDATVEEIKKAGREIDVLSSFQIYRASISEILEINIRSEEYTFKVTKASTMTSENNETIGYMYFDSFTASATAEINQAFDYFQQQGIKKLVIDLRYNGGGSVTTTSILLDKLIRDRDDEIQFTMKWNDKNQDKNEISRFETDDNSIALEQIIFLTTKMTASASEIAINAMRAYLGDEVVLIGTKTHGKPVGMAGRTDGEYIYYLVNFVISNNDGFYDYFDGIDVTEGCETYDDLSHQLGDIEENMLQKALFYIDNGHC
jgi:C-terminal peptidase prc